MNGLSKVASNRTLLIRTIGTIAALILLVYLLSQQGWGEILIGVRKISPWHLILVLVLTAISRIAVAARWHILLRSAGLPISFQQSIKITFAGLFASNFLPTTIGGDVVRLAAAIRLKFDAVVSAASLVVDRLIGMVGMAMVLPFSLTGISELSRMSTKTPYTSLFPAIAAAENLWRSIKTKSRQSIEKVYQALSHWLKDPRSLLVSLAWSWVHMLCLFGILALLYDGLGEIISFPLIGGLYSLVYFFTLIPISINGYGLQEISMTFLFNRIAGISMGGSLTAALLFRTLIILGSLPGAFFLPNMMASPENASQNPLK